MAEKISKDMRDAIAKQIASEIAFARSHKKKRTKDWQDNERLVYMEKQPTIESRANVELGRGPEFVHTFLSKIDDPLSFTFVKRKTSQTKRVRRLNALRERDAEVDMWDIKDIAGKKQMTVYGRSISSYYASSDNGVYRPHNDPVDVYDFLIDPKAGGIDIELARYLGDQGVEYTRTELEEMKDNKDAGFISIEITRLLKGTGNTTEISQEDQDKISRTLILSNRSDKQISNPDVYKFWRWGTTYKGHRYYCLYQESAGKIIRIKDVAELFGSNRKYPLGPWWYWTYAATIDLTEFWTPSPLSQVRDIFQAQNVTINQTLDNGEEYNKPMRIVNVAAIENLAELKYRREGNIKVKSNFKAEEAVQFIRPNPNPIPLTLFDKLEMAQEKASGVTANSKGVSNEERVKIYQGNEENVADRYGFINKSYAFGYRKLADLYILGVRMHLRKKMAIDIIGPDGVETEEISMRDIFKKDEEFDVSVQASSAENQASASDKRNKLTFLDNQSKSPKSPQNAQVAYAIGARTAGFSEQEIRELLDNVSYADAEIMAEADRDLEDLLDGENVQPNLSANLSYKQRFVEYMKDHYEDMTEEQFQRISAYLVAIEQVVVQNTVSEMNRKKSLMQMEMANSATPATSTPPQEGLLMGGNALEAAPTNPY